MTPRPDPAAPPDVVARLVRAVRPRDGPPEEAVRRRLDSLVKPPGSLGRLEDLSVRVARICGDPPPELERRTLFLLAADHGVSAREVSAYPREVTAHMCRVFSEGGSAVQALAAGCGVEVVPADVGVDADLAGLPGLEHAKVRRGSRDLAEGPALGAEEAAEAIAAGAGLVERHAGTGPGLALTGEMGIGNSTSASALAASLAGVPPAAAVGPGTGVSGARLERKREVVARALGRLPRRPDPFRLLCEVGGLEIAGLVGVVLAAAARRRPVLLDGLISTAAGAVAAAMVPAARGYLLASHRSPEPAHGILLRHLGLRPILELGLRLGEGTGAVLAAPVVDAAGRVLRTVHELPAVD